MLTGAVGTALLDWMSLTTTSCQHELHAADAADGAAGNLHLGRLPNDVMEFPPDPVQALE